jgi:SAM-dependent methyltransferase/transcriptional regulator with XRE-family HTH domain
MTEPIGASPPIAGHLPPPAFPSTLTQRLLWGAEHLGGKRALAAAAEISEAQLYRYLEGAAAIPHDKLAALALALGADPAWLLTGRGPWAMPTNRVRPEFRGALLENIQEELELLLVEYQRKFPPAMRSRMVRYLYEILRFDESHTGVPTHLDKFKMLQYLSFLAEMQTETELDILREAFEIMEYQGFAPNFKQHHQLLTTWCNLLVRGMRGYYNSYAGQVYFERMGQQLPPDAVAELHGLTDAAFKILGHTDLDWLDVGCGNGRHLAHLHKFMPNLRIQGLELSDLGVELCKKLESSERLPVGCVQQGDMRLAPFKGGSFDVVFAHLSLMEIPYLGESNLGFAEVMEELQRILRPGGLILATVPYCKENLKTKFNYKLPRQQFYTKIFEDSVKNKGWQLEKLTPPKQNLGLIRPNNGIPQGLTYIDEQYVQVFLKKI